MVDELTYENHESFKHDMHGIIDEAFEHPKACNSSSAHNKEVKAFLS